MMNESYQLARHSAALFDFHADGRFRVSGPHAEAMLNALFSIDLDVILPWKGGIGLFLTDTANVIATATIFKADDAFYIFTESGYADALYRYLSDKLHDDGIVLEDLRATHAWIVVLGPRAQEVMVKCAGEDILGLPYLSFEENKSLAGLLFRMGFCGEFEYRLLVPVQAKSAITTELLAQGAEFGIGCAQPEAIETLMLEMRSCGKQHLPIDADPIEAGLHWMINFRKDGLTAGDTIHANKLSPARRSLMLRLQETGCAHDGDRLMIEGEEVGFLARVCYSPTLGTDIGLAFVEPELGYVGVSFEVSGRDGVTLAIGTSAPLFVTKTVLAA